MNNIQAFININLVINKIQFIVLNLDKKKLVYENNLNLTNELDNIFDLNNVEDKFKEIILEIENTIKIQIDKVNLMIENKSSNSLAISIKKNFENKKITRSEIEYLLQNLRQTCIENHSDKKIIHILVKKCLVDNELYTFFPINKKCKNFIMEIEFIYFQKLFVTKIEKFLKIHQIEIKKFICTSYAKSLLSTDFDDLFEVCSNVLMENNINEINVVSRNTNKMGFFERFFHIFS